MAKDINWGYVFGGVSVVVGLVALYKMNQGGGQGTVNNVFPALNEQAMQGPSVPSYNVPTLSATNPPQNTAQSPDYMNNNQLTSRKRKLHKKWADWRGANKKACCDPCRGQSTSVLQNATPTDMLNGLFNLNGTTDPEPVDGSSYNYGY